MTDESNNIPFQVQHIINNLLNERENVYARGNYRPRLEAIHEAITKAFKKYDHEVRQKKARG